MGEEVENGTYKYRVSGKSFNTNTKNSNKKKEKRNK